jgi:hypothetical protein
MRHHIDKKNTAIGKEPSMLKKDLNDVGKEHHY